MRPLARRAPREEYLPDYGGRDVILEFHEVRPRTLGRGRGRDQQYLGRTAPLRSQLISGFPLAMFWQATRRVSTIAAQRQLCRDGGRFWIRRPLRSPAFMSELRLASHPSCFRERSGCARCWGVVLGTRPDSTACAGSLRSAARSHLGAMSDANHLSLVASERRNGVQSRRPPCGQQTRDGCDDDHLPATAAAVGTSSED